MTADQPEADPFVRVRSTPSKPTAAAAPADWKHDKFVPAVAGLTGGVGLAILVGYGGMPLKPALFIVGAVGIWAVVVIVTHYRRRPALQDPLEPEPDDYEPEDEER